MALWNAIRLLYVYAYISLSGYITKLLVIHLQHLRSLLYECMLKLNIPKNWAERPPPLFCLFVRDQTILHMWNTHGPHNSNMHSDCSYPNIFFRLPTLSTFSKYSHIEKYRTQDHGAGGSPIGSLMTIHTNIPAIPITLLDMTLWNVIMLLYCLCLYLINHLHYKNF